MSILLSLSPFAVFFVLMRLRSPMAGLVGALVASLLLCAFVRRRGEAVKILEVGSLALFGLLCAYTWLGAPTWSVATVRLAVDAGLLAIVLVSLAIGQPFTLQYARERVPEHIWAMPVFFTTNVIISSIWAGAFAVLVACRRRGRMAARGAALDRHRRVRGGLRGSGLVQQLVSGRGPPPEHGRRPVSILPRAAKRREGEHAHGQ
jgi:hypothetical protein